MAAADFHNQRSLHAVGIGMQPHQEVGQIAMGHPTKQIRNLEPEVIVLDIGGNPVVGFQQQRRVTLPGVAVLAIEHHKIDVTLDRRFDHLAGEELHLVGAALGCVGVRASGAAPRAGRPS